MSTFKKAISTIAATFTIIPFFIAVIKFSFFYSGCMDGFGVFIIGTALIWFAGAPAAILRLILMIKPNDVFPKSVMWKLMDIAWIFSFLIIGWVTYFHFSGSNPYDLHHIFSQH